MPDLLAHVLIGYAVATLLSWRYDWMRPAYVTVAMAGTILPDMAKADLLIPAGVLERALGVPFDWFALHTLGGVAVSMLVGAAVVRSDGRRRVAALLGLGAATHLLADALLLNPSGRSYAVLWPLTRWHPPTPGLYLSTQIEPTLAAAAAAVAVRLATRARTDGSG